MTKAFAAAVILTLSGTIQAQEMPKPGPEVEVLKRMVGEWDLKMAAGGQEFKGTAAYKMDLGGMWLASTIQSEMFGHPFTGKGFDSFDPSKKKYVSVWVDSTAGMPVVLEGGFDAATKTMTMTGEGPGMDRKAVKYKTVTTMPDADTIKYEMFTGGEKEPMLTVTYKRKK